MTEHQHIHVWVHHTDTDQCRCGQAVPCTGHAVPDFLEGFENHV